MGKNRKSVSLKIPEKALHVLKRYEPGKKHPDDFVFPYLEDFPRLDEIKANYVLLLNYQAKRRYKRGYQLGQKASSATVRVNRPLFFLLPL